jgi:hypothetical protein
MGMRSKTTPHVRGGADPLASSPKSLSKVSRMRTSRAAHASASESVVPGAAVLTQTTSCTAASRAVIAAPGKFSLARKRISGCAREYLLRAQRVARISEARDDVVVRDARVIPQDLGLVHPSAIKPITNSTDSRVPRMTGLPASTSGASAMRGCSVMVDWPLFSRLTLLQPGARRCQNHDWRRLPS